MRRAGLSIVKYPDICKNTANCPKNKIFAGMSAHFQGVLASLEKTGKNNAYCDDDDDSWNEDYPSTHVLINRSNMNGVLNSSAAIITTERSRLGPTGTRDFFLQKNQYPVCLHWLRGFQRPIRFLMMMNEWMNDEWLDLSLWSSFGC